MKTFTVPTKYPTAIVQKIDDLVKQKLFPNRSEFVRYCVMTTISREFTQKEPTSSDIARLVDISVKRFFNTLIKDTKTYEEFYKRLGLECL